MKTTCKIIYSILGLSLISTTSLSSQTPANYFLIEHNSTSSPNIMVNIYFDNQRYCIYTLVFNKNARVLGLKQALGGAECPHTIPIEKTIPGNIYGYSYNIKLEKVLANKKNKTPISRVDLVKNENVLATTRISGEKNPTIVLVNNEANYKKPVYMLYTQPASCSYDLQKEQLKEKFTVTFTYLYSNDYEGCTCNYSVNTTNRKQKVDLLSTSSCKLPIKVCKPARQEAHGIIIKNPQAIAHQMYLSNIKLTPQSSLSNKSTIKISLNELSSENDTLLSFSPDGGKQNPSSLTVSGFKFVPKNINVDYYYDCRDTYNPATKVRNKR